MGLFDALEDLGEGILNIGEEIVDTTVEVIEDLLD